MTLRFNGEKDLRRIKAIAWIDQKNTWVEGVFHGWSQNHTEYESGPGHFPVAIVETSTGKVYLCHAESVQFIDEDVNSALFERERIIKTLMQTDPATLEDRSYVGNPFSGSILVFSEKALRAALELNRTRTI